MENKWILDSLIPARVFGNSTSTIMNQYLSYLIFLPFLLLFFFWGCEKDPQNGEHLEQDEIIFQSYNPAIELKSYQTRTLGQALYDYYYPTPKDSVVSFEMDLNNDEILDFKITASHRYEGQHSHTPFYVYLIQINGLSPGNLVSGGGDTYNGGVAFINSDDSVDLQREWVNLATIKINAYVALPEAPDNGYIAVKMDSVFGFIHFEMFDYFGIRILDHGLNNKPQGSIRCGQKE